MKKPTKIDLIREELERIASPEDRRDPITPTMNACWSYTRVMVFGKTRSQSFDFDALVELLKKISTGSGEAKFWRSVDSTKPVALAIVPKHDGNVVNLHEYALSRKA